MSSSQPFDNPNSDQFDVTDVSIESTNLAPDVPILHIVIVCGGPSPERDISIMTGQYIYDNVPEKYSKDLVIIPTEITQPWQISHSSDEASIGTTFDLFDIDVRSHYQQPHIVFFNALHGEFGEDGIFQKYMEDYQLQYTGSGVNASIIGCDKNLTNTIVSQEVVIAGEYTFTVPRFQLLDSEFDGEVTLEYPFIIKPQYGGSSLMTAVIHNDDELDAFIVESMQNEVPFIIQEFVEGLEITVPVLDNTALTIGELSTQSEFFDFETKYSTGHEYIIPARIENEMVNFIKLCSEAIHKTIGAEGISRIDYIINGSTLYFLEINTSPGMTKHSWLPLILEHDGISWEEFFDKMLTF